MFGRSKRTDRVEIPSTEPSDQYRRKSTGERVTVLRDLGDGSVKVAVDRGRVLREDIVNRNDITPA